MDRNQLKRIIALFFVLSALALGQGGFPSFSSGGGGKPASPVNSVQFNNSGAFGGSANLTFNDTTKRFGLMKSQVVVTQTDPPASSPTAALAGAGAGNVDNGGHNYVVTYVTAIGETTGDVTNSCGDSVVVVDKTVNGKVQLSAIPLGTSDVTGRKIYRSKANVGSFACFIAYLLTTINDNTTTTYLDNTADSGLGAQKYSDANTAGGQWMDTLGNVFAGVTLQSYNSSHPMYHFRAVSDDDIMINLDSPTFGNFAEFKSQGATGGLQFDAYSAQGQVSPLLIHTIADGSGTVPPNQAAVRITTNFGEWIAGTPLFGVDVDYATDTGNPWPFVVYSGEDGSFFSAGYSTAGGFVGINTHAAPTSYFQVDGTVYPTRPIMSVQAGAGQTADLFRTLASDGTTVLSAFNVSGQLRLTQATPANAAAACTANTFEFDAGFLYVCTASGAWKRVAIATW